MWVFDTKSFGWAQIPVKDPWPAPRRCAGFTTIGVSLSLWGGSGVCQRKGIAEHNFLNDIWRFWPDKIVWELIQPSDEHRMTPFEDNKKKHHPFPRYTPVYQSVGKEIFLFGGYTEDRLGKRKLNDTWLYFDDLWTYVPEKNPQGYGSNAKSPGVRYGCMSASDGRYAYICGGFSDTDLIDLWRFDMVSRQWELLYPNISSASIPSKRYSAAFVCYNQKLFLFGGRSRKYPKLNYQDLWIFDLVEGKWIEVAGARGLRADDSSVDWPPYHAKLASALVEDYWYIWGGEGINGHVSDFWRLNLNKFQWQLIQAARNDDPLLW
jgi:hypothetical protein